MKENWLKVFWSKWLFQNICKLQSQTLFPSDHQKVMKESLCPWESTGTRSSNALTYSVSIRISKDNWYWEKTGRRKNYSPNKRSSTSSGKGSGISRRLLRIFNKKYKISASMMKVRKAERWKEEPGQALIQSNWMKWWTLLWSSEKASRRRTSTCGSHKGKLAVFTIHTRTSSPKWRPSKKK